MELLYLYYGVQAAARAFSQMDANSTVRGHAGEALHDLEVYLEAIETPARKVGLGVGLSCGGWVYFY